MSDQRFPRCSSAPAQLSVAVWQELFFGMAEPCILLNHDGMVVSLNHAAEALTEWSLEKACGVPVGDLFRFLDGKSDMDLSGLTPGSPPRNIFKERTFVTQSGRRVSVSARVSAIRSPDLQDRPLVALFLHDRTNPCSDHAQVLEKHKQEALSRLAGGIAHDFNNILTGVFGYIGLAQQLLGPTDSVFKKLALAEQALIRARNLSHQLLLLTSSDLPEQVPTDLMALIYQALDSVRRSEGITGVVAKGFQPSFVGLEKTQFLLLLQHLFLNAAQVTPTDGKYEVGVERVSIEPGATVPLPVGLYLRIWVRDYGPGIPVDIGEHIFDPYFSTRRKGKGLGLAVAQAIAKNHQGLVQFESGREQGTTFHVYVPYHDLPAKHNVPADAMPPVTSAHRRILLMDDEDIVRDVLSEILTLQGYEVDAAATGDEAVRIYQTAFNEGKTPAAVILDLTMPSGDGAKNVLLRLLAINPRVKAIVASGYALGDLTRDFSRHGFAGAIAKPFDMAALRELLERIIESPGVSG